MNTRSTETVKDWENSRKIQLPFDLPLADGGSVKCYQILRNLPGRRLVCAGDLDGHSVLVKLFMGKQQFQEAVEDAYAVKSLMVHNISTPALLREDHVREKAYPVLLFEYLPDAQPFSLVWQQAKTKRRMALLKALLEMLAQLHIHGLRQKDFHLQNFLLDTEDCLYAIDGGDYAISKKPVNEKTSIKNLGIMFGHLPWELLRDDPEVLDHYFHNRRWATGDNRLARVIRAADRFRRRRARMISRKAFRRCSEFLVRRQGNLRIYQRRDLNADLLDQWIKNTNMDIAEGHEERLKSGNSQTVWRIQLDGQPMVVKRYNLKHWRHAFRRAFTRSRASKSWENAHRLRAYYIATAKPQAMIEEYIGWFRHRAWFITDWQDGPSLRNYLSQNEDEVVAKSLAAIVNDFGNNGLVHGDMKATNFILADDEIRVIDLDSMKQPHFPYSLKRGVRADKKRFLANWNRSELREKFACLIGVVDG